MQEENKNDNLKKPEKKKENTGMAVIAYILFFVPLLTDSKDDPFVKFHVKQSIVLVLFSVMGWIVSSMLMIILIGFLLSFIVSVLTCILFLIGIINAINGEKKELPVIGQFAEEWFKF